MTYGWQWGSAAIVMLCACTGPTEPGESRPPDPQLGQVAFEASCASCHASRDGFDLAFFGFPAADVVRRGVAHVDSLTARDIVAYLETLDVEPVGRFFRAFQPLGTVVATDSAFWRQLFGTDAWPSDIMTVEWLRALDLRDVAAPIAFPLWSSESNESDWMPEVPLRDALLDADGGTVRSALEAYRDAPTLESLLAFVESFQAATSSSYAEDGLLCSGGAAEHLEPIECFEARRWASSLAAQHLLRSGASRDVPHEVAQLWWDTGEAGVSVHFVGYPVSRTAVASWLYMSSVFAPDGFPGKTVGIIEESGYMGQFLQSEDRARLAVLVTLRRMVSEGPLHEERPYQAYRDAQLAVIRAPQAFLGDVFELSLGYLLDEQAAGRLPAGDDVVHAGWAVDAFRRTLNDQSTGDPERDAHVAELIDAVEAGLGSS